MSKLELTPTSLKFFPCPRGSRYRLTLLKHAVRAFPAVLRDKGGDGNPCLTRRDASELSNKLFVHWFFMDRCRSSRGQVT